MALTTHTSYGDIIRIVALHNQGMTNAEISETMHIFEDTIADVIKVKCPKKSKPKAKKKAEVEE